MKKLMTILGAILFASFLLTSCGEKTTVDSDAQKTADLYCAAQKLINELDDAQDPKCVEATGEYLRVEREMRVKYEDKAEDWAKYEKLYIEAINNCK